MILDIRRKFCAKPFAFGGDPALETVTFPNGDACQFFVLNYYTRSYFGDLAMHDGERLALEWFAINSLPQMPANMKAGVVAFEISCDTGVFQMT